MSTRGAYGFYKDGKAKVGYNHSDSYISGLGVAMARYIRRNFKKLNAHCDALTLVQADEEVTDTKVLRARHRANGTKDPVTWYDALRNAMGDIPALVKLGHITDDEDFLRDSLFCEFAYIINLDTGMLEVYQGFQKDPKKVKGRYAFSGPSEQGYAACSLVSEIPLNSRDMEKQLLVLDRMLEE